MMDGEFDGQNANRKLTIKAVHEKITEFLQIIPDCNVL
jgi:hypothetical protein